MPSLAFALLEDTLPIVASLLLCKKEIGENQGMFLDAPIFLGFYLRVWDTYPNACASCWEDAVLFLPPWL